MREVRRLQEWLDRQVPHLEPLPPGAPSTHLASAEQALGRRLPLLYRHFVQCVGHTRIGLFGGFDLLPLSGVENFRRYLMHERLYELGLPEATWPFAADGGQRCLAFDVQGAVWCIDAEMLTAEIVSPSFEDWLQQVVDDVEAGAYPWSPRSERLVPVARMPDESLVVDVLGPRAAELAGIWVEELAETPIRSRSAPGQPLEPGMAPLGRLMAHTRPAYRTTGTFTDRPVEVPAQRVPVFLAGDHLEACVEGREVAPTGGDGLAALLGPLVEALRADRRVGWPDLGCFGRSRHGFVTLDFDVAVLRRLSPGGRFRPPIWELAHE